MGEQRARRTHEAAPSVAELLAGVDRRASFVNPDGRSGAAFERVWIGGEPHIVKYVHPDDDFLLRQSGDLSCRTVRAWEAGLLDAAPDLVDHAIVGAGLGHGRNGWGAALLMRDVSAELLPGDASLIPQEQHARFLDHLAGFCAATLGWHDGTVDDPELLPYAQRWAYFGYDALAGEEELGWPERVPRVAAEGWERFGDRAPSDVLAIVDALRRDPSPLANALQSTPSCFLHGDVKASNVGQARDGRVVLIDWAYVGQGPPAHELAWHLSLDRSRLPRSKEATIEDFRSALARHGANPDPWWPLQLALCLLGALVQFGWEKALGDDDELGWWCDAARTGAEQL